MITENEDGSVSRGLPSAALRALITVGVETGEKPYAGSVPNLDLRRVDTSVDKATAHIDDHDTLTFHPLPEAGGVKFDQDKPRMDLLDPYALEQLAKVLGFGAQKYAAHNWRKGLHKSRLIGAALRHLFAYLKGEDVDPETGLSHVAHAMCCCMFLLGLEHRTDLDDRWKA